MVQLRDRPVNFRTSEEAFEKYLKAAERAGLSVSEWMRLILDLASGGNVIGEQLARTRFTFTVDLGGLSVEQQYRFLVEVREAQRSGKPLTPEEMQDKLKSFRGRKVRDGKW